MSALTRRVSVPAELNLPQWKAYSVLKANTRLFMGWGRGVGKTWFVIFMWCVLVAQYDGVVRKVGIKKVRGVRIMVMLPTLKQFKSLYWETIEEMLLPGGDWAFLGAKLNKTQGTIKFPGGSWVKPFPAAKASGKRARGMRSDVLCIDEIDDIDADTYFSVAIPTLSDMASLSIEILAGTPTQGRQGLWSLLLEMGKLADKLRNGIIGREAVLTHTGAKAILKLFQSLDPDDPDEWPAELSKDPIEATIQVVLTYHAFHATYRDAPETIKPLQVAMAKATMPADAFEREYEANPNAGEGLVYSLVEDFHVRTPPPNSVFSEFHAGMDFGRNGALLRHGIQGRHERMVLWILQEYFGDEPIQIWDKRALGWKDCTFWPDTSRTDRCDGLRTLGLTVMETDRGPGSVADGIERVRDLMHPTPYEVGTPPFVEIKKFARLYIAPWCVHTIREFNMYRYPKRPDGTYGAVPEKKNDHLMDCLRMVALGVFGRPTKGRQEVPGR